MTTVQIIGAVLMSLPLLALFVLPFAIFGWRGGAIIWGQVVITLTPLFLGAYLLGIL